MDQLSRLTAFRQALYERVFTRGRDAQQDLLDALMLSPPVHSFPELSLDRAFRRRWPSLYKALEAGRQDEPALTALLLDHLPEQPLRVFALDESAWPHPEAGTLEDRGFVHGATPTVDGRGIVIGHSYSVLAYCAEPGTSWTLPLSVRRVPTASDAIEIGIEQVQQLYQATAATTGLDLATTDRRYGNHRFLGGLRPETERGDFGVLARLRANRVLYGAPGPYGGRGRRPKHGAAFRFKDAASWPAPAQELHFTDARYGEVVLQLWEGLHAREDAETTFSVLRAAVHLERVQPPEPLWLAWRGPTLGVKTLWQAYQQRPTIEAAFRFRKQYLAWTLPRLQTTDACARWTNLVTAAQWTLYLSQALVRQRPQPWQRAQEHLTPERVKQSWGSLFSQIGTPASAPKPRGKAPGWQAGRARGRRDRHPVVRKRPKKAEV